VSGFSSLKINALLISPQLDQFEDMVITDGKRKSRSCDSRAVKAPRGKKRKRNDEAIR